MREDSRDPNPEEVRLVTYLPVPKPPRALFEALADHVQRTLADRRVSLRVETRSSGSQKGDETFCRADEGDVAFMCTPSYHWLRGLRPPPVELLGVAPVFDDDRNLGRPVYFCDVVVGRG